MKLIKCYIENFGKLHNFNYNFQDGLNIINKDNGFGKTTFATFIKSMFYGLDAGVNVKVEKSDRKKYYPWQGGMYGGNIEFEIKDKKYRIERFFGKKMADDTFKLYNLDTNLESLDYTENIGEEIFKINKSAYERSTYIPQGQIQIDMEDSISAKLGNVLESENDINTSEEALKKINEAKKMYKKDKGKGGLIDEKKESLNALLRKLENGKIDIENLEQRKSQFDAKIKEIKQNEEKREKTQQMLSLKIEQDRKKAKQETYQTFLEMYQKNEAQYNKLKDFFKEEIPTDNELKNLDEKNIELERVCTEINNLKFNSEDENTLTELKQIFDGKRISNDEIETNIINCTKLQQTEGELQKKQMEYNSAKNKIDEAEILLKKRNRTSKIFLILSVCLFIIGFVMYVLNIQKVIGIVTVLITVISLIFQFIKNRSGKNKDNLPLLKEQLNNLEDEMNKIKHQQEEMEKQINEMLINFNLNTTENANKIIELSNLKAKYSQYNKMLAQKAQIDGYIQNSIKRKQELQNIIQNALSKYFNEISVPYSELIQKLRIKKNEIDTVKSQFENAKIEKEKYESQNDIKALKSSEKQIEESEQQLKENISVLNNKIDSLVDEKNQIKNQIEFLENKIDENEYLETDIENLKEEIEALSSKYEILKNTETLLQSAKESFSSSYLKDMINGFNKYLKIIDTSEINTNVDIKLDVKVDVNGSQKEIKHFSAGYKDLVYICMRFSLINALFKDESPFVVLDDPLVNLDEKKTKKALEIINEFAKEYQIIYFICNSSRA